jgi:hypothetical protein
VGQGAQQRGHGHRPEVVHARESPQAILAEEVGSGKDIFLAFSEQEDEQRLRAAAEELGSLYVCCYEPFDGEEIG